MDQKEQQPGAVRVGMVWGGIGAVVGFLVALLGSLAAIPVAGFVGFSCGRRAAAAEAGRPGAVSGLIGGLVAAPGFLLGAALGALVSARQVGMSRFAETLSGMVGSEISPDQAWQFFLLSLAFSAVIQTMLLIPTAIAAGAWVTRKR